MRDNERQRLRERGREDGPNGKSSGDVVGFEGHHEGTGVRNKR